MDIKEIGVTSVVLIGGAVVGVSQFSVSDVLEQEILPVAQVSMAERQSYMDSLTSELTEFYGYAIHGTDNFNFSGPLVYKNNAQKTRFTELIIADQELSKAQVRELRVYYADGWFCDDDDYTIFTDKGWTYQTTLQNKDGKHMVTVDCKPDPAFGLRVG